MIAKIDDILYIYEKYIYKSCKNKKKLYLFEKYKMINITNICNILNSNNYEIKKYNIFLIKYPKYRIVMSLNLNDKIINHYITLKFLIPKLSRYLDYRNIATRKNMGTDYGIKLVKKYIEKNKKYQKFYILKLDISKYFYNIDHNILKAMIKNKLDEDTYKICSSIIDSTNAKYINLCIKNLKEKESMYTSRKDEINKMPYYLHDKGLPIGNMTSQFFAIFYLYELDHYIVNDLHIKYMIRYMDDYVLIHHDKDYLNQCMHEINNVLNEKYCLSLNNNKSKIHDIKNGFDFLGYRFRVINNKTICSVSRKTIKWIKKRIKSTSKKYNNGEYKIIYSIINNYYYGFKYSKSLYVKRYINRNVFIYK